MDVSDDEMELEIETPENGKKGFMYLAFRLTSALLFPIFAFLFLSILLAILMGHFSITTPLSVPFQCKILSSSVDLRSSKICELGLLNYKAKHVFYPNNRSKFRCRYDYYWASVFEVEYEDNSLGQTRFALAEAPNEALPLNCRPNFGAAWLTKDKFKVNKTYDCWYTSGISKVSLYRDDLFSCQAKDPSQVEMIKRYFILSKEMLHSSAFWEKGKASYWRWETIAGVITGFSTSIITISFIKFLQYIKSWLRLTSVARIFSHANIVFFKRACFLVAYFSFMGWLTIQYAKRFGLPEIYRVDNY
ncbi:uncharacterized protein [Populus alba]|uniref:Uncharacterized protein n=1 Tax=Populus alba TaxID=43335 RepID=A0A4U5PV39_POPAL|nr:uncharacterized protein LOC118028726 [Populus alba]TKS01240.1 hypothetical protein D5086_0000177230 [Populus alba]